MRDVNELVKNFTTKMTPIQKQQYAKQADQIN